ncbi:DUF4433 domain-containing protein [Phenylobacterium sp.]|uniref:type II toxin-antitoxin system toxin DNA ADP-ribosyl transferase DarT n=1 Tax=Phenylobacterium sp. TaxID=1871053 RepID=UPI00286E0BE8|nr:DUF4433 domain-containing protein [Phenylobacterium sp.]
MAAYMPVPAQPKIYHIAHVDRLASIVGDGFIFSDAMIAQRQAPGTIIGMNRIKERRQQLQVGSHPGLRVGECAPFYFCSRSVMLYLIHKRNAELSYQGGQEPIVHLEADLHRAVAWAGQNGRRWAFTLSNAGAYYFEDCADLALLDRINWDSVGATQWAGGAKEGKQAEFLMETGFPWALVERIGVSSNAYVQPVSAAMGAAPHRPQIEVRREWYY